MTDEILNNTEEVEKNTCCECGNEIEQGEEVRGGDNVEIYCQQCHDDLFVHCYNCGDELDTNNGERWTSEIDGNNYCNDCYRDRYFLCDNCGYEYDNDEYCDGNLCSECYDEQDDDNHDGDGENVHLNKFINVEKKVNNDKSLPMAVEIEAEEGDWYDCRDRVCGLGLGCGISTDGSLNSTGIEVQTAPCKIKKFRENIVKICNAMIEEGYVATNACGLHCHIGLKGTTDKQLIQIIKTFSVFDDVLFSLLPNSRRYNRYCKQLPDSLQFSNIKNKRNLIDLLCLYYAEGNRECAEQLKKRYKDKIKEAYKFEKYNSARYFGFNLHSFFYRGTIEIRHHTGTLSAVKIIAWAELLQAILYWARFKYSKEVLEGLNCFARFSKGKLLGGLGILKLSKKTQNCLIGRFEKFNSVGVVEDTTS